MRQLESPAHALVEALVLDLSKQKDCTKEFTFRDAGIMLGFLRQTLWEEDDGEV